MLDWSPTFLASRHFQLCDTCIIIIIIIFLIIFLVCVFIVLIYILYSEGKYQILLLLLIKQSGCTHICLCLCLCSVCLCPGCLCPRCRYPPSRRRISLENCPHEAKTVNIQVRPVTLCLQVGPYVSVQADCVECCSSRNGVVSPSLSWSDG